MLYYCKIFKVCGFVKFENVLYTKIPRRLSNPLSFKLILFTVLSILPFPAYRPPYLPLLFLLFI